VAVLPYIEQQKLHDAYDVTQAWDSAANAPVAPQMPRLFAFHGDYEPGVTITNFVAVVGPETVWPGREKLTEKDITDGTSNTILVVENAGAKIPWLAPRDLELATMPLTLHDPLGVSSKYLDPAVAMLDGSVQRLHKDMTPRTLRALLTARGGEKLQQDDKMAWSVLEDGRLREVAPKENDE
jgi:hypothetical protein